MRLEMSFGGIDALLFFNLFLAMVLNVQASFVETPRDCRENKILQGMKGNFTSPGGFDGYPNNTVCSWIVEASHNSRILVTFHNFDLEWSKTCLPYDYVKVSDKCNNTNEWSENLMTSDGSEVTEGFCGNMTMFNVTSRCGNVHVEFRSDDSITGRGFNATFEVIRDKNKPEIMPFCFGGNKTTCTDRKVETATNTIRLECEVEANPQAEVHWLYLGTSASNPPGALDSRDFRMTDFRNGTLEIKNLRRNDTGFYQCVANNSLGNDTTAMELFVKEKCKCPKTIHANWYLIPPYIRKGIHHEPGGLFPLLLPDIVQQCCGNCTGGDGPSRISYSHRHDTLDEIKHVENFDQMDTITFPISGKKDDRYYQNEYKFMPLISSPGVAFIIVDEPPGTSAKAVFNSVLSGWPVLLLTLLMALLSGMIMWGLDTWYNPDEFPRSFIKGSGEGFWWAFVTMTTVGYGDRSPRGFLARIFAIVWVLVGLVITSIFTGVVTTSLTAITLSTDVKLYGTQIGAVANSTEYRLGLNKNAKLEAFPDLHSMVTALKKRDFKGVLVDTYVAGEYDEFSSEELRVNKIIDHNSYYGVVFGPGDLSGGEFQHCFEDYVLSNKASIFETVKENTKPMDKPSESAAVERSSGLFDSSSPLFQNSVYTCLGLLLFFTACGIIWDYGYMRHWRKRSELDELELLGGPGYELAKRNLDMMDALMLEVQEFYENWTKRLDDITERHEEEQKIQSKQQKK